MNIIYFSTKLGKMVAAATDKGICFLDFVSSPKAQLKLTRLKKEFSANSFSRADFFLSRLQEEVGEYFAGQRREFTLPLHLLGTDFQKSVWKILQKIPYGETWSYRKEAEAFGNVKAVRAVARANGENKIALLVPCHRVIGADGSLTGYAGGLVRKKYLIALEKRSIRR